MNHFLIKGFRIKILRWIFIILIFLPSVFLKAQDMIHTDILSINLTVPVPESQSTFKSNFIGAFSANICLQRCVSKHFHLGPGIGFSLFETNKAKTNIDSKMKISSLYGEARYDFLLGRKMGLSPSLQFGLAEIIFRNKNAGSDNSTFEENGGFLSPALSLNYKISKRMSVGVNTAYEIIFKHFGDSGVNEEATIRLLKFGLGGTFLF